MSKTRAQYFRTKKSAAVKATAVPHTLPCGAEALLTRPDLTVWMMTGRIPQAFVAKVMETFGKKGSAPDPEELMSKLDGKDFLTSLVFVRDFVRAAMVSPVIVTDREPNYDRDEIAPTDLGMEDLLYIFKWAMGGSRDIPVPLSRGGETSVEALENFSDGRPGAGAGADQP